MIVKRKGKYCLLSKKTRRNLGCYDTREGAEQREREVQFFKHMNRREPLAQNDLLLIEEIRRKNAIKLWGDKMAIHWTGMPSDPEQAGFDEIIESGKLNAGTSFTISADLPFPVDNNRPVGLVFRRKDLEALGYRNLSLDQKGVTSLELLYELTGGEDVPIGLLQGVVSYRPAALREAKNAIRRHRNEYGRYSELPSELRTKLVPRPKYQTFDTPRPLAALWGMQDSTDPLYRTVDVPVPQRREVHVTQHLRRVR